VSGCVQAGLENGEPSWCVVDERTCPGAPFGVGADGPGSWWDHCTSGQSGDPSGGAPPPDETTAGCRCAARWWLPPQDPAWEVRGACVNPDGDDAPWCVVNEASCRRGLPAGRLAVLRAEGAGGGVAAGEAWDRCASMPPTEAEEEFGAESRR